MPRANRPTPTGQMSLFQVHQDAKRQNNRWIVSGTATVGQLLVATEREPEEHYGIQTAVQRPLHHGHCLDLARYFKATSNWIIAPFVFTSYGDNLDIRDGQFREFKSDFEILDGQHRIQALHIAATDLENSDRPSDKDLLRNLKEAHIALEYIENFGPADAAQLFVDLNKGKRVSPSELAYLDGRDPVVNIIRETLEQVEWVKNRTDTARANPDPAGEDVWTVSSLKTVVKALEVGVTAPLPKARRTYLSTDDGKQESVENLSAFLNWLPIARVEYKNLQESEPDVADERTRHYAYDPRFVTLMAETWANSKRTGPLLEPLAHAVGMLNITRHDAASDLANDLNLLDDKGRMKPFSRADYSGASVKIRQRAGRS